MIYFLIAYYLFGFFMFLKSETFGLQRGRFMPNVAIVVKCALWPFILFFLLAWYPIAILTGDVE